MSILDRLAARIAIGVSILAFLAFLDLRKNKHNATRWREYLFLLFSVLGAMTYGVLNDQITSRISWEYFYYGKGLDEVLGEQLPPDPAKLSWHAARIGLQATWTAGLILGVTLLIANNPRKDVPRLSYASLMRSLPTILIVTITCAALLGLAGYLGWLTRFSTDFEEMLRNDELRPRRFMLVYGIHLGGYVGGFLGLLAAVAQVLHQRKRLRLTSSLEDASTPPQLHAAGPSAPSDRA